MRRRLSAEARRAEIIEITQQAIVEDGYRSLSLREIARRCGMSTPGLMHHFPDLTTLLEAVLGHRDELDRTAIMGASTLDASLLETLDAVRRYYGARSDEVRSFDSLEAEAQDPNHPAHDYFRRRDELTFDVLGRLIDREFEDPEHVSRVLRLLLDGLRVERLRSVGRAADTGAQWDAIERVVDAQPRKTGR
ncbi:helix-turn-helix domain-containing protein [Microbacterium sp. BWT-B31]|uniref:TetR/AcrR family transcriptional regulator n=1 Tax=Microbacterium sp. BWT-B31 TaxID=3232072 RepID=UPI0035285B4B